MPAELCLEGRVNASGFEDWSEFRFDPRNETSFPGWLSSFSRERFLDGSLRVLGQHRLQGLLGRSGLVSSPPVLQFHSRSSLAEERTQGDQHHSEHAKSRSSSIFVEKLDTRATLALEHLGGVSIWWIDGEKVEPSHASRRRPSASVRGPTATDPAPVYKVICGYA
jgi:hypothetical protein